MADARQCRNFPECGNDTRARTGYCSECWGEKISRARRASLNSRRSASGDRNDRCTLSVERLHGAAIRLDEARARLAEGMIEADEALEEWRQLLAAVMRNGGEVKKLRDAAVAIAKKTEVRT